MKLIYGKKKQISFANEKEKYMFIGYITSHGVGVTWEKNNEQGAWGEEGRITFISDHVEAYFPTLGYSAGNSAYHSRLNCNDFVSELLFLGFVRGSTQDVTAIRGNIQVSYQADFDKGSQL